MNQIANTANTGTERSISKLKMKEGMIPVLYPQISYECEVRTQTFDIIYQELWERLYFPETTGKGSRDLIG